MLFPETYFNTQCAFETISLSRTTIFTDFEVSYSQTRTKNLTASQILSCLATLFALRHNALIQLQVKMKQS